LSYTRAEAEQSIGLGRSPFKAAPGSAET